MKTKGTESKMPIQRTISVENAANGFVVRVELSDSKGNWKTRKYIAKTRKEASCIVLKNL